MRPECNARILHDLNLFPVQHSTFEFLRWKLRSAFEIGTTLFPPLVWQLSQARNDIGRSTKPGTAGGELKTPQTVKFDLQSSRGHHLQGQEDPVIPTGPAGI